MVISIKYNISSKIKKLKEELDKIILLNFLRVKRSKLIMKEDHANPRYFLLVSTWLPLYFLRSSNSGPPFLRISSSSLVHKSLASLVSI